MITTGSEIPDRYADDPDAFIVYPIGPRTPSTDPDKPDPDTDWSDPVVTTTGGTTLQAAWLDDPAPTRRLRVPLAGLAAGRSYALRLVVSADNDIPLGYVNML